VSSSKVRRNRHASELWNCGGIFTRGQGNKSSTSIVTSGFPLSLKKYLPLDNSINDTQLRKNKARCEFPSICGQSSRGKCEVVVMQLFNYSAWSIIVLESMCGMVCKLSWYDKSFYWWFTLCVSFNSSSHR